MKKFLVKFSADWADEFRCDGFAVLDEVEATQLKAWASTERTFYFGTNEGWDDEEFINDLTFTEITEEQAETLMTLFPKLKRIDSTYTHDGKEYVYTTGGKFGIFPSHFMDTEDEEDFEDEE